MGHLFLKEGIMKFFKYIFCFIGIIAAIVLANMTYDYIKVIWYGNAIEKTIEDFNSEVE